MGWFGRKKSDSVPDQERTSIERAYLFLERHKIGFKSVRSKPLRTLEGDNYRYIIENTEAWQRLEERMNAYFNYAIEIFPYRDRKATRKTKLRRPKRFYAIQREMIETCFPAGRQSGEPGDSDLRDLLAALQLAVRHNLRHYYIAKRLVCELLMVSLVTYFFQAYRLGYVLLKGVVCNVFSLPECAANQLPQFPAWLEVSMFIFSILLIIGASWFLNWLLHTLLVGALNVSCIFVDGQAAIRTKNLTNLVDDIFPRIDSDRYELEKAAHRKEWPERSKKWAVLIYWLAKRLEYIERFVQVETWLIRREHYWMQLAARIAFYVIAIGWLGVMAWIGIIRMKIGSGPHSNFEVAFAFAVLAGCVLLWHSFTQWNTPFTLIEDKLQPANWMRYRDVHLQEKFARQIARDQSEILEKEDQLAGH